MSRCLLHYNRLDEFKDWLSRNGYQFRDMSAVGDGYQLFQIKHPKRDFWAGVYWRHSSPAHVTVDWRIDYLVKLFLSCRKLEQQQELDMLAQNARHCVATPDPVPPPAHPGQMQLAAEFRAAKRWPYPGRTCCGLYRDFGLHVCDDFGDLVKAPYTYPHGVLDSLSERCSVNYPNRTEQARRMDYIQRNSRSAACP